FRDLIPRQILAVVLVVERQLPKILGLELLVFLFKDSAILTLFIGLTVVPVLDHLVDKEQREDFDTLSKEPLLLFQMRPDGFADLNSPHGRISYITSRIAGRQHLTIGKLNRVVVRVDLGDDETTILVELVGLDKE